LLNRQVNSNFRARGRNKTTGIAVKTCHQNEGGKIIGMMKNLTEPERLREVYLNPSLRDVDRSKKMTMTVERPINKTEGRFLHG